MVGGGAENELLELMIKIQSVMPLFTQHMEETFKDLL